MVKPYQVRSAVFIREWDDLRWLARKLPGWVYRGQQDSDWTLSTSLERACLPLAFGTSLQAVEAEIVTSFKRAAGTYLRRLPQRDHWLEWMALIQHHGGPTRLLDFTRSIYVAAFFAFDDRSDGNPAIWCVNHLMLREWLKTQLESPDIHKIPWTNPTEGSQVFDFLYQSQKLHVATISGFAASVVTPIRLNRRLWIQQGTFLAPLNLAYTLEENLFGMFDLTPEEMHKPPKGFFTDARQPQTLDRLQRSPVIQIVLDKKMRPEALTELGQMNITHASLFPGIDGYTRQLKRQAYWHSLDANALEVLPQEPV